jgi:cold shock CspA family protein
MTYQDKEITCRECGGAFMFTAGEQEFYASKGFSNEPTRCPAQRRARKNGNSLPAGSCSDDVTGNGQIPESDRPSYNRGGYSRDSGYGRSSYDRGYSQRSDRGPRRREEFSGTLPTGSVLATVLRIDPAQRFLFARVEEQGFDVYVHHTLFNGLEVQTGDQVRLTIEPSDRGPRARSFDLP